MGQEVTRDPIESLRPACIRRATLQECDFHVILSPDQRDQTQDILGLSLGNESDYLRRIRRARPIEFPSLVGLSEVLMASGADQTRDSLPRRDVENEHPI